MKNKDQNAIRFMKYAKTTSIITAIVGFGSSLAGGMLAANATSLMSKPGILSAISVFCGICLVGNARRMWRTAKELELMELETSNQKRSYEQEIQQHHDLTNKLSKAAIKQETSSASFSQELPKTEQKVEAKSVKKDLSRQNIAAVHRRPKGVQK